MMASQEETYELRLGEDIEALCLGFTKMCVTGKKLFLYNGRKIEVPYNSKNFEETADNARKILSDCHEFEGKDLETFAALLINRLGEMKQKLREKAQQKKGKGEKSAYERALEAKILKCKADIEHVTNAHLGISSEAWRDGLICRYEELHRVVNENIPEIWSALEFTLSSHRILNIYGCTLPFIGIILARPSTCKTVTLSLLEQWYCTYYTDTFSPKSWITHSTAKESEEELSKIDMLPQIKDRHFLTPELAPIFTTDEKDLGQIWGTITRIADGHGLQTNSGAWGHRGYGDTMFVWTGAAVDVPYKVYKLLGNLGFKIYFFRLPYNEKADNDLLKNLKEDFNLKKSNIASALYEYLAWFEIGPQLIQEGFLSKMKWDFQKDDDHALLWIIKIAKLLSHLRCITQTWTIGEDSQGSNYGYTTSQPESPERAAQVLCNLARGHALLTGRNFVILEDIPIVVKTALSTAIIDRVGLLHALTANEGTLNTKQVANALKVVNKTALRVMTELCIIGLVDMWDDTTTTDRYTKRITLKKEFQWLLSEDFQKLCEGFNPVNYKPVKEPKAGAGAGAETGTFSKERISTFWKTFDKLVEDQIRSNPGMEIDKGTISREDLQDELVSTGNFIQSDAAIMIDHMEQKDEIEQIDGCGTIRRKVKP